MLLAGGPRKTFWKRCHSELVPKVSSRFRERLLEHPQLKAVGGRKDWKKEVGDTHNDQ